MFEIYHFIFKYMNFHKEKKKNQRIILADYFYTREAEVNKANISFSLRHVHVSESQRAQWIRSK